MTPGLLEAATVAEEVAAAGEIAGTVDLSTISQQLDQVITWQMAQLGTQVAVIGCIVGVVVALLITRWWR